MIFKPTLSSALVRALEIVTRTRRSDGKRLVGVRGELGRNSRLRAAAGRGELPGVGGLRGRVPELERVLAATDGGELVRVVDVGVDGLGSGPPEVDVQHRATGLEIAARVGGRVARNVLDASGGRAQLRGSADGEVGAGLDAADKGRGEGGGEGEETGKGEDTHLVEGSM